MDARYKVPALLALLALAGCATLPSGPSVMVLPTQGKPFEVFLSEDALCRSWAQQQLGVNTQEVASNNVAAGATLGTVLGAGIGALFGAASGNAGAGAAIGAGGGLLLGTASGAESAQVYGYEAQRRYDNSYVQCMYAKGNQVPTTTRVRSRSGYGQGRVYTSPPPPPEREFVPSVPPVPPDYFPAPGQGRHGPR